MRTRNIIVNAGLMALALIGTALAAPIPLSVTGLTKAVSVDSHALDILGGGSFNAQVGNPTILNPVVTTFWCIDNENFITPGAASAQYNANIILVTNTTAQSAYVRKATNTLWEDGQSFSAQQRYLAAAYLVEKIIAGNSGFTNDMLQQAIWRLTDVAGGGQTTALWENAAYLSAKTFIQNAGVTTGIWATVSGVAAANGVLSASDTRQTFLVQVGPSSVPEPGTYALMGGGLLLLAGLRRRRAN